MSKSTILRHIAVAITLVAVVSMSAYAQRGPGGRGGGQGGPGGRFGGGFGGGFGGNPIFTMMQSIGNNAAVFAMREDVRKELDLTEDQVDELRDAVPDRRTMMQDLGVDFRSLGDMSEDERADLVKDVQAKIAKKNKEVMDDVADILSTKQTHRLKELQFQFTALTQRNPAGALRAADIKVDDDDEEKIKETLAEVEKELAAKIAKLRRTAYMEALGSVVNESKLATLMGEAFVFQGGFGGGAFGRGGPGGRGPGQARGGAGGGRNRGGDAGRANPRRGRRPAAEGDEADETNPRRRR